jgi:hypothetical protein
VIWKFAIAALVVVAAVVAYLALSHRQAMNAADQAWATLAQAETDAGQVFDLGMIADLPEVAQRYFTHAIRPGTPIRTTVVLEMKGRFLLGGKDDYQSYDMRARQILAAPYQFVWQPSLESGIVTITGSDALVAEQAWTRFWINGLVPVANSQTSPDLLRSAQFRPAVESVWAPASLLPGEGISWTQIGSDVARVTVAATPQPIAFDLTLDQNGAVVQVVGQRWSNANPEQAFRLQPFGGSVEAEATFGGFTIPAVLKVGNHFGTGDYFPFFQAEILSAVYQ